MTPKYYTGRKCKHGHTAFRYTSTRQCVKCVANYTRHWQTKNPTKHLINRRNRYGRLKAKLIAQLGGRCACRGCGEKELIFLCVDHKNGKGSTHRRLIGGQSRTYAWLAREIAAKGVKEVRRDFRVLCFNCNFAIHWLGSCPHAMAS